MDAFEQKYAYVTALVMIFSKSGPLTYAQKGGPILTGVPSDHIQIPS